MDQRGSGNTARPAGCCCPGILRRMFGCSEASGRCACRPEDPQAAERDQAERELSQRTTLLEFSYKEVLDATKHQDDKISRLLTAVAFLTAAALALAGLAGGRALAATFRVDDRYNLPLALIGLGGFLAGVTVSVIMLLASTTTPLTLPGLTNSVTPSIRYVPGPSVSQYFFNEIAETALPGWYYKWRADIGDLSREHDLRLEHNDSLVRETHNLGVRVRYKYQRSNEAVAVLAFALLSFVLAAILILIAAARLPPNPSAGTTFRPLSLNITVRAILAAIFFVYCLLQLLSTQRSRPPTILELAYPARRPDRKYGMRVPYWRGCYVLIGSLVVPQLLLLPVEPRVVAVLLAIAIPAVGWLVLGPALPWHSKGEEEDQRDAAAVLMPGISLPDITDSDRVKARKAASRRSWLAAGAIAAGYAALGTVAAVKSNYQDLLGLAGAYATGMLLAGSAVWQINRKTARRVEEFRQSVAKARAKSSTS